MLVPAALNLRAPLREAPLAGQAAKATDSSLGVYQPGALTTLAGRR